MFRSLKTIICSLGLIGAAYVGPVTSAEAFPFHHKVCETVYRHHRSYVECHWVVFRRHPIRSTLQEFLD